jgi:hypothetical protein
MSKGHGWLERELIALFDDRQHTRWTIADLCRAIYYPEQAAVLPSRRFGALIVRVPVSKGQRVAVLRALRTSGADQLAWVSAPLPNHPGRRKRGAWHERHFNRVGTATRSKLWAWRYDEAGPIWVETFDNRVTATRISLTLHGQKIVLRSKDLRPMPASWEAARGWAFVWTRSLLNGSNARAEWEERRRWEASWRDQRERNSRLRLTGAEADSSLPLGG